MHLEGVEAEAALQHLGTEWLLKGCAALLDLGVNVIICHGPVAPAVQQYLTVRGVLVVANASFDGCRLASQATGCAPIAQMQGASVESLGHARYVRARKLGSRTVVELSGLRNPVRTILLCAPTSSVLDEAERSVHDALCAVLAAASDGGVVPGGGAVQFELAHLLRQHAVTGAINTAEQIGMGALADAMEVLPQMLAKNAGLDAPLLVAEGQRAHHQPGGTHVGVDLSRRCVRDMVAVAPMVIEPVRLVRSMLVSAVELVATVMCIDENIMMQPRKQFVVAQ